MAGHVRKRVGSTGTISWRAEFKFTKAGTVHRGSKQFSLKREADEWLATKLAFKVGGQKRGNSQPLAVYLWNWLEIRHQSGFIRGNTAEGYATRIRGLEDSIGTIKLSRLTHKDLRDYLEKMRISGLSRSTINQMRSILNRALADAVIEGTIAINPAVGLRIERAPRRRDLVTPTPEDVKLFLADIDNNSDHGRFFRLLAGTGMRRSEAGALRWSDVDITSRLLRIRKSLQRSGNKSGPRFILGPVKTPTARRSIPLTASLTEMLITQRDDVTKAKAIFGNAFQDHDLVFCMPDGQPIDLDSVSHLARRTRNKLNLSSATSSVHCLRHFFATQLIRAKVDAKTVQHLLGHSKIQTTLDLYVDASEEAGRAAIDMLSEIL